MSKKILKPLLSLASLLLVAPAMADWPVAVADRFVVHESSSANGLDLLKNDIGSNLKVVSVNDWSENGARIFLKANPVGVPRIQGYVYENVSYQPKAGFVGVDGFWYVIEDDQGRRNAIRVVVEVKPASLALPTPLQDFIDIPKDTPTRINPLVNDLFTNMSASIGETFRGKIVDFNTQTQQGGTIEKVVIYPDDKLQIGDSRNGQFFVENTFKFELKYTPPAGFVGVDSFTYAVSDSLDGNDEVVNDAVSWTKVTLNVVADNNAKGPWPVGSPDTVVASFNQFVFETALDVLENDTGENLIIKLNSAYSQNGARVKVIPNHPNRPTILYSGGSAGQDRVWYNIEDAYGRQNFSYVDVTVQ